MNKSSILLSSRNHFYKINHSFQFNYCNRSDYLWLHGNIFSRARAAGWPPTEFYWLVKYNKLLTSKDAREKNKYNKQFTSKCGNNRKPTLLYLCRINKLLFSELLFPKLVISGNNYGAWLLNGLSFHDYSSAWYLLQTLFWRKLLTFFIMIFSSFSVDEVSSMLNFT